MKTTFQLIFGALRFAIFAVPFIGVVSASAEEGHGASYYKDGEIHVNILGTPEEEPLTKGHWDFKPSWSKTDDRLVFFRRLVNDKEVSNWKTAICIINVDGTEFHQLTDGTHTDFNQTWTRDGTNTPIWNRKHPMKNTYQVMAGKIGGTPGEEVALTDQSYHTWGFTCLKDGRILVASTPPQRTRGYFLMTPNANGTPKFERIECELEKDGVLARISLSPEETKVCFEYQKGFKHSMPGRTLYIADFNAKTRIMSNFKPFANEEGKNVWFAYPRWVKDASEIVYQAGGKLYLYKLADGSTRKVSSAPNTKSPEELVPDPAKTRGQLKLLWLSCGNQDGLIRVSQRMHTYLKQNQVPHVWNVDSHGHDPTHWRNNLYHLVQQLFKDTTSPCWIADSRDSWPRPLPETRPLRETYRTKNNALIVCS